MMAGFSENARLSVVLDRRKALTLSPLGPDKPTSRQYTTPLINTVAMSSIQTESPYKIPNSSTENGCTKVHWTQIAHGSCPKTSVQLNGTSSTNHTQRPAWQGGFRRELRLVLNDVLKTKIGRRYLQQSGCGHSSASQSQKSRRESQMPKRQPKPADHRRTSDDPQPKPADYQRRRDDLHIRSADLRKKFEDPQPKTADHRRRSEDSQPKPADHRRRRDDDPQPTHVSLSKLKTGNSLRSKPTDSEQPKLINSSRSESDHSEQSKPVNTPEANSVPSEQARLVDSTKTRTLRSVECVQSKPVSSETPRPANSVKSKPVSSETPKSLTFSKSNSRSKQPCSELTRSGSSSGSEPLPSGSPLAPAEKDLPDLPKAKVSARPRAGDSGWSAPALESESEPEACEVTASPERVASRRTSLIQTPKGPYESRPVTSARIPTVEDARPEEVSRKRSCENGAEVRAEEKRNGVMREEECVMRKSVLRLSGDSGAEEPPIKCPRLVTPAEDQPANEERRCLIRAPSRISQSEPIVLSSEEECDDEDESRAQNGAADDDDDDDDGGDGGGEEDDGGDKEDSVVPEPSPRQGDTHSSQFLDTLPEVTDMNGIDMTHLPSVFELPFSALYMGGVKALANGKMEITEEKITFPLLDSLGEDVTVVMETSQLCTYSLLDGPEHQSKGLVQCGKDPPVSPLQSSRLVKQGEGTPPSVLLLWVSEDQAQQLRSDLSIIQPGTSPDEDSACVCLYLHECVLRVEQALLASVMDIVGLRHGNQQLLSPLKSDESLLALLTAGDTHLLRLLAPDHAADTHTQSEPQLEPQASASTQTESIYTLLHSRHQGRYSVRVAKPGPEWIPYKHRGPTRRLIQFPPPPCKGSIAVTTEDLECLDSGQFLNDVIIDFYLKYLLAERTPKDLVERCHVFSSFFYKQLTRRDNANEDSTSTTAEHRRHQRVKTWTRNVDIFSKDFLFVPVNQESHWYLVVVCYPGLEEPRYEPFDGPAVVKESGEQSSGEPQAQLQAQVQAQEATTDTPASSEADKETNSTEESSPPTPPDCTEKTCKTPTVCKRPCILIMDSLKLSIHKRVVKLLREYLQVEWEVRRGASRDFSPEVMMGSSCKVPLQDNSSDCGLYLLHYAETFLQDPVVHFDLPLRLERWFPRQQVRRKRDEIRNLVLRLCRFQSGMMGNVVPRGTPAPH
ncbi:sentrin-specific protease 7-like isoform X2 [Alosa sapidissima]|uniref:sentrin-specific protease 7-like isoform X2 n=1 Tax=Alosa sapidissima TaxID=34773 RepID=UPI001C093131|nr:sentrin-specific protease 7-like isoform X2 [Alosa sapidissima]